MTTVPPNQAYRKAYACYKTGDFDKAEEICRAILRAIPADVDAAYLLAIIASRKGRQDESDRLLQQAVEQRGYSIRLEGRAPSAPRHAVTPHAGLQALLLRDVERYVRLRDCCRNCKKLRRLLLTPRIGTIPGFRRSMA